MNERLVITVPASLALWGLALVLTAFALTHETARPMTGRDNITVRLVTLSEKPAPRKQEQPKQPPKVKPVNPTPVEVTKPEPVQQQTAAPQQHWQEAQTDNHGAVVTYQPMPKIPDDLRREAFDTFATARFHVAVDGGATVELLVPSQNPRLNRLLLEALKSWRFNPATDGGRPVASTFDIHVRFAVE